MKKTRLKRTYGTWAGNPSGFPERDSDCIAIVWGRHMMHHQCTRKRGHGPDGLYCKQHDPERKSNRQKEKDAEYKIKASRDHRRHQRPIAIEKALVRIANGRVKDPVKYANEVLKKEDEKDTKAHIYK